jgi:hypothetical protein
VYFAAPDPDQAHARHQRIAAGIAVSLALHALLLAVWRNHPVRLPAEPEAPRALAVRVEPLPPKPEPAPAVPPRPAQPRSHERARSTAPIEAMPSHAEASAPRAIVPRAIVPETSPTPERPAHAEPPAAQHFDADAARRFARRIADDPDPAKVGTAVAQFPDESYQPHTKLERVIGAAKRRNCKDGIPGGLLAPLYLMFDKKDSGCKW